ncbi:4-hydroxy-tetrahydrodipicolinate synthase [Rhodoferax saidenbachensis]|uniref:4-hydroxy-tetrahydrodipicolinate synthase n=1 Tax=Rhodoferax saidenbachensis TaxID=1484693 RepID=A0ABU1ZIR3_9BURK|nr:4-hydroxy-tetrahydrodipicolinate synthase [Rhodoferax saidenbachensis]MDR7305434.1 4-hydroxy-tetrahydrodipicolinate synthase [Rhodoferax saidenbachensis]
MHATDTFSGLWIPLVTPFHNDAVDHAALRKLVQHLVPQGIAGIAVCGSTGEAAALSADEQLAVLDTVAHAAPGLPLMMGLSGYHLPDTLDWVGTLNGRKLAGLLVPAPHYVRPSQTGLLQWFTAIADASDAPVVVYDIPARTGVSLALATLRTLAQHPHIVAIKDCAGDAAKTQALIADGRLQVLAGDDANIFTTLALGGAGAIAAGGHVQAAPLVALMGHMARGELAEARALWRPLLPLIEALFAEPNPAPVKALLARQGWMRDELRAPMTVASGELTERLVTLNRAVQR